MDADKHEFLRRELYELTRIQLVEVRGNSRRQSAFICGFLSEPNNKT